MIKRIQKILITGDSHSAWKKLYKMVEVESPDLLIHCGDWGTQMDDRIAFEKFIKDVKIPVVGIYGNHDDITQLREFHAKNWTWLPNFIPKKILGIKFLGINGNVAGRCISGNTKVRFFNQPLAVFKEEINGKMIQVNDILVTPEHLFLTPKGWLQAKDLNKRSTLLISSEKCEKEISLLEQERRGITAREVYDSWERRLKKIIPNERLYGYLEESKKNGFSIQGKKTSLNSKKENQNLFFDSGRYNLFGRNYRWRGNYLDSLERKRMGIKGFYFNSEYFSRVNGLFGTEIRSEKIKSSRSGKMQNSLENHNKRNQLPSSFEDAFTLSYREKETGRNSSKISRISAMENFKESVQQKRKRVNKRNKNFKFKRAKIELLECIEDWKGTVYDFIVPSHFYFANNVLVHNCRHPWHITENIIREELRLCNYRPRTLDFLISHECPLGFGDILKSRRRDKKGKHLWKKHVGWESLFEVLKKLEPKYAICGHTHFQQLAQYKDTIVFNPGYGAGGFYILLDTSKSYKSQEWLTVMRKVKESD